MTDTKPPPPPNVVLDLILAFRRSKTMFAAVKLGVFDALADSPAEADALARALGANPDALERLLDACVGLQLLRHRDGLYENAPEAATYLCANSPHRMTGYINCSNDVFWQLWEHLEGAIRDGRNRWVQAFPELNGRGSYWDYFYNTQEAMREFLMGMHGYGLITSPRVVSAFPLDRFKTLVDLGGGTGHLAIEACKRWPHLKAKIFDLPEVIRLTAEVLRDVPKDVRERIEVVEGNFFTDPLPKGDLYALARTLHDWPQKRVQSLLDKVAQSVPDDGALLIAEKILAEDKSGPDAAQMQNLNMLVCAEGRERTLAEYKKLLRKAKLPYVTSRRLPNLPVDVILAQKQDVLDPLITIPTPIPRVPILNFVQLAQMYSAFFDDARIGCVISDMEGRFVLVNKAYADIHGRTVEETLRLSYKQFTPIQYQEEDAQQIAELREKGWIGPFDKEYIAKDKKLVPVRITLQLIKVKDVDYIWSIVERIKGSDMIQRPPQGTVNRPSAR